MSNLPGDGKLKVFITLTRTARLDENPRPLGIIELHYIIRLVLLVGKSYF